MRQMLAEELPRVREAALAWRNGLAGLFVGLLSFGLIKGRTDVDKLAPPYGAVVGGLLLLSLVCGTAGALFLLRAANGAPATLPMVPEAGGTAGALYAADHLETMRAVGSLRRGVVLTMMCAAMLVAGVALTWYGPGKEKPRLLVRTSSGTECGEARRTENGVVVLKTKTGEVRIRLSDITGLSAVETCPMAAPSEG
ncbi:hypothetical protein [Streptomyces thermovulgaris]|uniref:hypothetical protein n=1 Tax=Streptomyces thermovulgaris TaxID=1934 RepID=UPI001FE816CC|nr:hypothetical protein [Streptomyces thermovulgaris]